MSGAARSILDGDGRVVDARKPERARRWAWPQNHATATDDDFGVVMEIERLRDMGVRTERRPSTVSAVRPWHGDAMGDAWWQGVRDRLASLIGDARAAAICAGKGWPGWEVYT